MALDHRLDVLNELLDTASKAAKVLFSLLLKSSHECFEEDTKWKKIVSSRLRRTANANPNLYSHRNEIHSSIVIIEDFVSSSFDCKVLM
jgi:hypothetical protein